MNKIIKELQEIERKLSTIEFKNYWSNKDWEEKAALEKRAEELKAQAKGLKGIAVRVTYKDKGHFGDAGWYLTDDPTLCCSDEPVLFDDEAEAKEYLAKADLDDEMYDVEFVETTL